MDIIVPVDDRTLRRSGREKTAQALRAAGVRRILLAAGTYKTDPAVREREFLRLGENLTYFKSEGFDVGVWIWTFWCEGENSFTRIADAQGNLADKVCPLDEDFLRFAAEYLRGIAALRPSLILFDDDFRFGHLIPELGCVCENHLRDIRARLHEQIDAQTLAAKAFTGGANKYRDAWMDAAGDSLRGFAVRMRAAVDSVDPTIRLGLCSCITTWDTDGTDAAELARLLAGGTRPFLRLIGAPYWAARRQFLQTLPQVIETERMEAHWCAGQGIEVFTEGDCYPRPRHTCPAALLEAFDLAMLADGAADGIMKYMFDYYSPADYETGYTDAHRRHAADRAAVQNIFAGKAPAGLRIVETQHKLRGCDLPAEYSGTGGVQNMLFSPAARLLAGCSIPTVYGKTDAAAAAFGENAKYLRAEDFENGLILDANAARILHESGTDVGICEMAEPADAVFEEEFYIEENLFIRAAYTKICPFTLQKTAKPQSLFYDKSGKEYVSAYTYENAKGQRFLVFAFDAEQTADDYFLNYARPRQIAACAAWLQKKPLPALCPGNPGLYMLCAEKDGRLAVGLWNLSPDAIECPLVQTGTAPRRLLQSTCRAKVCAQGVETERLEPYGFAAFEVLLQSGR